MSNPESKRNIGDYCKGKNIHKFNLISSSRSNKIIKLKEKIQTIDIIPYLKNNKSGNSLNDNNLTPQHQYTVKQKLLYKKKTSLNNDIHNKDKNDKNNLNNKVQLFDYNKKNENQKEEYNNIKPLKFAETLYKKYNKEKNNSNYNKFNNYNHNNKNKIKKRMKNCELTNYLKRKEIDNIPLVFPLYLSFNNKFESHSQRERVDKNLDKLICIKTHLSRNPKNKYKLIKEFMITNGIKEEKYFKLSNMMKFENYLKEPINFSPKYTMNTIIKNAINSSSAQSSINKEEKNDEIVNNQKPVNYYISPLSDKKIIKRKINYKHEKTKNLKINNSENKNIRALKHNFSSLSAQKTLNNSRKNLEKKTFDFSDNNLKHLVHNLEDELNQIKIEKKNALINHNQCIFTNQYLLKSFIDNNKYVPNLCMSTKGFSEQCKKNIEKYNNRVKNIITKQERIKNINNRMYYNNIIQKSMKDFDLNDIRKKQKLTEFIVMKRGKERLFKQYIEKSLFNKGMKKNKVFENLSKAISYLP